MSESLELPITCVHCGAAISDTVDNLVMGIGHAITTRYRCGSWIRRYPNAQPPGDIVRMQVSDCKLATLQKKIDRYEDPSPATPELVRAMFPAKSPHGDSYKSAVYRSSIGEHVGSIRWMNTDAPGLLLVVNGEVLPLDKFTVGQLNLLVDGLRIKLT